MAEELRFSLGRSPEELGPLTVRAEALVDGLGLGEDVRFAVALALEEVVVNVQRYAWDDGAEHQLEVRLRGEAGRSIEIEVRDDGRAFDPLSVAAPDLDAPIDERQVGGLGVHLVRKLMDDVRYRREDGQNVLYLCKRAGDPAGKAPGESPGQRGT